MLLEEAIEKAMSKSKTLSGATRRLMSMCEAEAVEDLKVYYRVRTYIVPEHYRHRPVRKPKTRLHLVRRAG